MLEAKYSAMLSENAHYSVRVHIPLVATRYTCDFILCCRPHLVEGTLGLLVITRFVGGLMVYWGTIRPLVSLTKP